MNTLPFVEILGVQDDVYSLRYWYTREKSTYLEVAAFDSRIAQAIGMQQAIVALIDDPESAVSLKHQAKFLEIDYGTDIIIERGFEYPPASGIRHSLTMEAQARLLALFTMYNTHLLMQTAMALGAMSPTQTPLEAVLPLTYNSIDDEDVVVLQSADDVKNFCMTSFGTMSAILNSGTSLKNALRAMTDCAQFIAFSDPRLS